MTESRDAVHAYWRAFKETTGHRGDSFEALSCGDSPHMQDELADLIVSGQKRATVGLQRDFTEGGEQMPVVGGHVVVLDGSGAPRCIWRTTEVTIKPLNQVDARFAWDEGEGDRTLAWWLDAHHAFFGRMAEREGFVFRDDMDAVFERFTVVWPPEAADA